MHLFDGVYYYLSSSFSPQRQIELTHVLNNNGGTKVESINSPTLTHLVTNSSRYEGWQDIAAREEAGDIVVVTDKWADRSMVLGKLQSPTYYSADPSLLFSGVVACATELPTTDLEVLSAGITALGGQWRTGLTKDVTHLFAISPSSLKYTTALHFQEHTHVKVLLPHWFDDAVRLGMGGLDTTPYEWPDPILLKGPNIADKDKDGDDKNDSVKKVVTRKLDVEKKVLYRTASLWSPDSSLPNMLPSSSSSPENALDKNAKNVWQGRRVLLANSLELIGGRREVVEIGIKRAGGVVVNRKAKAVDADLIEECDVFITRFRSGKAYVKAVRLSKTIGTLPWVFHVQSTGILSPPMDQLLWYPIPKRTIEGFTAHEITVTNYTGESREYLKKLITAMGATFTPSMSGKNTVLIAAYISGTKTTKAASWSIPIVNHSWLEDCFVKWRNLTVALEKYIVFPPGVDFSLMLGERGVGRAVEEIPEEELEMLENEDEVEELEQGTVGEESVNEKLEKTSRGAGKAEETGAPPIGTGNSAKDAREVESIMRLDGDGDAVMAERHVDDSVANRIDVDEDEDEDEQSEESDVVVVATKPRPLSQPKSMASRLREKGDSAAKTRVKKAKPIELKGASSTPRRKSSKIEMTPAKKSSKGRRSIDTGTSGDEVEITRTVEKDKGKGKLVRRAGERYDSWINDSVMGGGEARTTSPKKNRVLSDDDDEEVEGNAIKGKVKVEQKNTYSDDDHHEAVVGTRTTKQVSKKYVDIDDDSEDEVVAVKAKTKTTMTRKKLDSDEGEDAITTSKMKRRSKNKVTSDEDEDEDEEIQASAKLKTSRRAQRKQVSSEEDEDESIKPKGRQSVASPSRRKGKATSPSEDEGESEIEAIIQSRSKSQKKTRGVEKAKMKEKRKPQERTKLKPITPKGQIKEVEADSESEEGNRAEAPIDSKNEHGISTSKGKTKPKATKSPTALPVSTPKRTLSVLMPPLTLTSKHSPSTSRQNDDKGELHTPNRGIVRTGSIRVTAAEHGRMSAPRPMVASGSKSKASTKPKLTAETPSASSPASMEDVVISSRSRRTAATKASQKLRDEIMPDVMNYQLEMRNHNKGRKSMGEPNGSVNGGRKKRLSVTRGEEEEEEEGREKKKRKVAISEVTKKGKALVREGNSVNRGTAKGSTVAEEEESEESEAPKPTKKPGAKLKSADRASGGDLSMDSKKLGSIRLMTTQVSLPDDVLKNLMKLGVKVTTRPAECTHLLAPHLVRTEKFLCALAVAPFILTEKWATDSAAAKKLLDEKDYLLHDKANEHKYDFVLADALKRAKDLKGGLFAKKIFYVTPKVPIDVKLLKNVVTTCGGQVTTQAPTIRILNSSPDKHVISCPDDISIWRPIAKEHPIYTHELILTAALKQEVDWESNTFRVPKSYT